MDILDKLEVMDFALLHLRDNEGELLYTTEGEGDAQKKVPMTVTVWGPGSEAYAKAQAVDHNRVMNFAKKEGGSKKSTAQIAEEKTEFLADITKEWSDNWRVRDFKGKDLSRAIFMNRKLGYIAIQVQTFANNWANFSKASTENSDSTSDKPLG